MPKAGYRRRFLTDDIPFDIHIVSRFSDTHHFVGPSRRVPPLDRPRHRYDIIRFRTDGKFRRELANAPSAHRAKKREDEETKRDIADNDLQKDS
jgi:hypothetical protein